MKPSIALLALTVGLSLHLTAATSPTPAPAPVPALMPGVKTGAAAPDFSLPGSDGKTYKLSDFKGKVVVLEWLNHDCPIDAQHYVGGENAHLPKLQRFAKEKNVVWLSIISSAKGQQGYVEAKDATADIAKYKASPLTVLLDPAGKVGHLYDAKTTPHMFIISKEGLVLYQGGINDGDRPAADIPKAKPYFKTALDEVLAGKKVTLTDTKPYGCNVKYVD